MRLQERLSSLFRGLSDIAPLGEKRENCDKVKMNSELKLDLYMFCFYLVLEPGIIDIRRLPRLFPLTSSMRAMLSISFISSSLSFLEALKALAFKADISKGATLAASEESETSSSSSALPNRAAHEGSFLTVAFLSPAKDKWKIA